MWVYPRAGRDAIAGEWQGGLKGPPQRPVGGQSRQRGVASPAGEHLEIPLVAVRILFGERSRTKRVEVRGTIAERVRGLLEAPFTSHPLTLGCGEAFFKV